jgi:hypothetical protein
MAHGTANAKPANIAAFEFFEQLGYVTQMWRCFEPGIYAGSKIKETPPREFFFGGLPHNRPQFFVNQLNQCPKRWEWRRTQPQPHASPR